MADEYRFELLEHDRGSYERISHLLRLVFPKARHLTPRYLEWYYGGNPDGKAIGCNAFAGGALVGHMAAVALDGRVEGEDRRGLYMVNGAVHPAHRGRRLQSRISSGMFEEAVNQGYAYCFGTGNKWSTGPLLTRFKMVRPLDARLGFGLPRLRVPGGRPSFEHVWKEESLRWRLANPEGRYSAVRQGSGGAVVSPVGRPGFGAILYQGDALESLVEPSPAAAPGPLRVWLGLDPAVDWKRSAFLRIPMRLRPSPLNLVYKDLTGDGFVPDPDRIVFRGLDFDAY